MTHSSPPLAPSEMFADRYRIVAPLGEGGMGRVYRAEHVGLRKQLALKVLGKRSANDAARFAREALAIARLDHRGCVRIYDHGSDQHGVPFIAMELVDGPTLAAVIDEDVLPVPRVLHVAREMLSALAHAHARGVIHRDLKPENVILGPAGRVVLIDFGLARLHDVASSTARGFAFGSPSYLAPERLRGEPHDQRADLYAVGVMIYEMLSGLRPFLGANPQEIMANALGRPPRPLSTVAADVPVSLEQIVRRALAKDPTHRFGDATHMLSALADVAREPSAAIELASSSLLPCETSASLTFTAIVPAQRSWLMRVWSHVRYGPWRWTA